MEKVERHWSQIRKAAEEYHATLDSSDPVVSDDLVSLCLVLW
jgi:hypothetical protein